MPYSEAFRLANASAIARADERKEEIRQAIRRAMCEVQGERRTMGEALALAAEVLK